MSEDSGFEQDVLNELGDDRLQELAQRLGTDTDGARQIVSSAATGLADGVPAGSVPQEPPLEGVATLGGLGGAAGGGLLAGALAKATRPVASAVAKRTGLPEATVVRGLELLVPVVLTVLSKRAAAGKGRGK
ncbi:DUF937 domain-containing protein [Streptomyces sp. NPDC059070]|uniref:DUF937 domain-containing protein n=1 Tax=unclassified Streptomyces TaxID=2593676 RepID=UPI0034E1DD79